MGSIYRIAPCMLFCTAQGRTLFMEGTKPRTGNAIGMFDLLKGLGMITIVLAHTAELYPVQISGGLSLTAFFPFIYREALMAAFFIASGYAVSYTHLTLPTT